MPSIAIKFDLPERHAVDDAALRAAVKQNRDLIKETI